MGRPNVRACVKSLGQLQSSADAQMFGLPNAQMNRSSQGRKSEIELALAEVIENATASAPSREQMVWSRAAMSSSACSQLTRCHPGSLAHLGAVRRNGNSKRSALWTISGAARPFGHSALPVG